MEKAKKIIIFSILFLIFLIPILFFVRLISPTEIDDVTPGISCPEIEKYNPDILWVIPLYNNEPISENKTWCNEILSLNKTLGMHGIYHQPYREFTEKKFKEDLQEGINEFQKCFNQTPEMFKPPQLKSIKENKKVIKNENLKIKKDFNQLIHKVYHCNNSGTLPNWLIEIF